MKANAAKFGNGNGNRGSNGGNSGGRRKNRGNMRHQPYNKEKGGQGKTTVATTVAELTRGMPTSIAHIINENGHTLSKCRDAKKKVGNNGGENEKRNGGNDGSRQSRSESYQPGFSFPSYSHANVTRLIEANSTEISTMDPDDWIVHSGANAFITPYKSDLRFYVETKVGQVKGFTGNLTNVVGKGP
jgi:hypothetical protein